MMEDNRQPIGEKFYLGNPAYWFIYRKDKNDGKILRADLFDKDGIVEGIRVSEGYGFPHKTHHQVINYFEVTVMRLENGR